MTPSTSRENFADRLQAAVDRKQSCLVVGLDPVIDRLPREVLAQIHGSAGQAGWTARSAAAIAVFLGEVVEQVAPHAVAVKPNVAFFERFGPAGWDCACRLSEKAQKAGLLVIADAKRGDIGHTAEAYADALLGDTPDTLGAATDAVTVHPYLGTDSIGPFLERVRDAGKGLFVLVRTSNPSAAELQDLEVGGRALFEHVAELVRDWGDGLTGESGLNPVGAVVGATAPEQAARVREILDRAVFLVPGYGAQGAGATELAPFFLPGGRGVVVNAARSIIFAHETSDAPWPEAVADAARNAREELEKIRAVT